MVGAETNEQALQLPGELALLRPQLHDGWGDGRLRGRAGLAACGIQPAGGDGEVTAGARQVFGEIADLLGVERRVHAFDHAFPGPVGGDAILAGAHLGAQFLRAALQPVVRAMHGAEFHAQLLPDVGVHRVVDGGGGQHGILRRERDLQHAGQFQRIDDKRVLHGAQRGVAHGVKVGADGGVSAQARGTGRQQSPDAACDALGQGRPPQRRVEFRIVEQVQPGCHLLHHRHAVQDFRLGRHHRLGERVGAQDALQFAHVVLAGVVEQGAGRGVARRDLLDRDEAQQRDQQDRGEQRQLAPAQDGEDRRSAQRGRRVLVIRCPSRCTVAALGGRRRSGLGRSIEHCPARIRSAS